LIKKSGHPTNRGDRLRINKKKAIHKNASPVYKLLKEKELLDDEASRLQRDRTDVEPSDNS